MSKPHKPETQALDSMLDPRILDPSQELIDRSTLNDEEMAQIIRVMMGMRRWRETEASISAKSRNHMKLNETDMKALRYLLVAKNQHKVATPGLLAEHLNISTAATTKVLDRLEAAGHIQRSPHPSDRRALMITITASTHEQVRDTVGRSHARRFDVAARLRPDEREVVIRFLDGLSDTAEENTGSPESSTRQGDPRSP